MLSHAVESGNAWLPLSQPRQPSLYLPFGPERRWFILAAARLFFRGASTMSARIKPHVIPTLTMLAVIVGAFSGEVPWQLFVSAAAQQPAAGVTQMVGADPSAGAAVGNMTYHGGPVQHVQKVFTIFWV